MNSPCHEPVLQSAAFEDASLTLNLTVNGQIRRLPLFTDDQSLGSILSALAVRKELVAIALNDTIVPRAEWGHTLVSEGDRLEIVHFVGGGCPSCGLPVVSGGKNCWPIRRCGIGQSGHIESRETVGNGSAFCG
jgi:sulfur carrier protein